MNDESKLRKWLIALLLVVGVLAGGTPAYAQGSGEDEPPGWLEGMVTSIANKTVSFVSDWYTRLICAFRAACMNAVGYWFCVECGSTEVEGGATWGCGEKPDCECSLCATWLGEHKHYISDAIAWVAGTTTVFAKFIPWELWSMLFTAYTTAAGALFAMRIVLRLGMWMFGAAPL